MAACEHVWSYWESDGHVRRKCERCQTIYIWPLVGETAATDIPDWDALGWTPLGAIEET